MTIGRKGGAQDDPFGDAPNAPKPPDGTKGVGGVRTLQDPPSTPQADPPAGRGGEK